MFIDLTDHKVKGSIRNYVFCTGCGAMVAKTNCNKRYCMFCIQDGKILTDKKRKRGIGLWKKKRL